VELLTDIDRINNLLRIPSIREAILDGGEIAREIESCSILFLEDTGRELHLFRKYDSYTSIFILCRDSFFDELLYDTFHVVCEIRVILIIRAGKSKSFIETLADVIVSMDIEKSKFLFYFSDGERSKPLPELNIFFMMFFFFRIR